MIRASSDGERRGSRHRKLENLALPNQAQHRELRSCTDGRLRFRQHVRSGALMKTAVVVGVIGGVDRRVISVDRGCMGREVCRRMELVRERLPLMQQPM